ncbi:hypothetical protein I7I51_03011 [Histoplasma capsulatum]|uniref:Uncharacterized protein n=1 Tax=Ajellomyces capsulatus TaxID=5037 RepID=A0A8A1MLT5_AJECA|nr:hypothetical protein I7I51_03011 [Histoplasma capsulatum]
MECTRRPNSRAEKNSNLPLEKRPEGARPPPDPPFYPCILDPFFFSPSHAPTVVACDDQERLSRAGISKFDYRIESHCCRNYPSPLVNSPGFPGEAGDANHPKITPVRTKRVSQSSPGLEQSKRQGGAAPRRRGDSCDGGDLPYAAKSPPTVPLRFSPSRWDGWWEWWGPQRTRLPHAGKQAEVHTHRVPRKTGLVHAACAGVPLCRPRARPGRWSGAKRCDGGSTGIVGGQQRANEAGEKGRREKEEETQGGAIRGTPPGGRGSLGRRA